ncbi:hypothetical protein K493DRAFT_298852 [Basidiobolus meristosporus CBS 931.73]|uniref:BZIP domain-containing protein n=1 Tax=Basidiobolus meristosporus CBS 931.73 TaxID=1314790 RepID=A0A1Y1YR41_9FUNG|nr:hypothetical protein K493DRAFT_298852 [Basidiobolus meristosporus CBS 931.73]|eukprot:ORY00493.1 hypothetical protein K493DRAFT_298852 [Basidiobolus meristosporus CBS 931.73]
MYWIALVPILCFVDQSTAILEGVFINPPADGSSPNPFSLTLQPSSHQQAMAPCIPILKPTPVSSDPRCHSFVTNLHTPPESPALVEGKVSPIKAERKYKPWGKNRPQLRIETSNNQPLMGSCRFSLLTPSASPKPRPDWDDDFVTKPCDADKYSRTKKGDVTAVRSRSRSSSSVSDASVRSWSPDMDARSSASGSSLDRYQGCLSCSSMWISRRGVKGSVRCDRERAQRETIERNVSVEKRKRHQYEGIIQKRNFTIMELRHSMQDLEMVHANLKARHLDLKHESHKRVKLEAAFSLCINLQTLDVNDTALKPLCINL